MKRCLNCDTCFPSSDNSCQACSWTPDLINGFNAYAPLYNEHTAGFKSSYFSELAGLEENNFWFRCRNQLIVWALKKYAPNFCFFLEIGCGTGFVLSGIKNAFPDKHLMGSELFTQGLIFASTRQPQIHFMQMDAKNIPFVAEFDSIGAFDVLEHVKEDEQVLGQIHQALKPEGIVLLTVPQHQWLWSPIDDYACHVRRYSAKELKKKLEQAGFNVLRSTSFVSSLLPAMVCSRFMQKIFPPKNLNAKAELEINPALNTLFEKILGLEIKMIQLGINFPLGGSRLVVAQKRGPLVGDSQDF